MKYTDTHEWVALEAGIATVGVTEYGQRELGDVVYVELPKLPKQVHIGDEVIILESTKAAIDLYTPVTGEIIEVNTLLRERPELVNTDPLQEGWLYKVKITKKEEYTALLDESDYQQLISGLDNE